VLLFALEKNSKCTLGRSDDASVGRRHDEYCTGLEERLSKGFSGQVEN